MLFRELIDFIFAAALIVNALLFIPQAIRIARKQSAKDISLITFFGFALIQLATVIYGYMHNDYILMFGYLFALITCSSVIIMALKYKHQ